MIEFDAHPDYANLPEGVKASISPKEYAVMDDESRKLLIQEMTTPEVEED